MSIEIKVPALPESVNDATVVNLHKQPGERVARDEALIDLETDKVVLEVPAPAAGIFVKALKQVGDTVTAGEVLALLGEDSGAATTPPSEAAEPEAPAAPASEPATAPLLSPAAARLVERHGVDPSRIEGSGKQGRITKQDVLMHLEHSGETTPEPAPATPAVTPAPPPAEVPRETLQTPSGTRGERREPMSRLRQRIAERLVQVQHEAAILTTFNEVNMQAVMTTRARYRDEFEKRHGIRLGFMSFFVKACVQALQRFPVVNARIDGSDIVYHDYHDIGIAVSSPRGLVVPVLRNADRLGFREIESGIADFGERARSGTLQIDELTGGTFSITNGGIFGSMLSTPLLNPPQSAILGMHNIQQRAVVEDGQVVARPVMYLALSYDHRIIDGRDAVQFLVSVKQALEDPARLLIGL